MVVHGFEAFTCSAVLLVGAAASSSGNRIPDAVVVIDKEFGVEQRIDYLKNLLPEPFGPQDLDVDERPGRAPPGLSFD